MSFCKSAICSCVAIRSLFTRDVLVVDHAQLGLRLVGARLRLVVLDERQRRLELDRAHERVAPRQIEIVRLPLFVRLAEQPLRLGHQVRRPPLRRLIIRRLLELLERLELVGLGRRRAAADEQQRPAISLRALIWNSSPAPSSSIARRAAPSSCARSSRASTRTAASRSLAYAVILPAVIFWRISSACAMQRSTTSRTCFHSSFEYCCHASSSHDFSSVISSVTM